MTTAELYKRVHTMVFGQLSRNMTHEQQKHLSRAYYDRIRSDTVVYGIHHVRTSFGSFMRTDTWDFADGSYCEQGNVTDYKLEAEGKHMAVKGMETRTPGDIYLEIVLEVGRRMAVAEQDENDRES